MKIKFSSLQFYLLLALFSLLFTSIWSYNSFLNIENQNKRIVEEAIPISNAASQLFPLLLDQELSVRGYVHNQDELSLSQFEVAYARMNETIELIYSLDQNHPIMHQLITEKALPLIEETSLFYQDQISLVESGQYNRANDKRYSGIGYINRFRTVDTEIRQDIDKIIQNAAVRSENASNSARSVIIIVGIIALLIFLAFVQTFRLERSKKALIYKSQHDALTGIYNRRAFDEQLSRFWDEALDKEQSISLLLIDVDSFKLFNDHYGHLEGDKCLQQVATVLDRKASHPFIAARYGGEEFAIILPDKGEKEAFQIAEEIRKAVLKLSIPHRSHKPLQILSISLGVASIIPEENESEERLIELADQALYQSKDNGRNRVTVNKTG